MTTHICDLSPSSGDAESARALLYRHGLPADVIDGVLCLHAQELAAVQRKDAAVWGVDTAAGMHRLAAADLIDPTKTAAAAPVVPPPADRAAVLALADKLIEQCPDHGCVEPAWEDGCHCEIVPFLRRMADDTHPAEEVHVVADDSDDPEHVDDCPGCEQQPVEETDTCHSFDVDGEPVYVRGTGDWTGQERQFAAEIVRAARRRYAAEHPAADETQSYEESGAALARYITGQRMSVMQSALRILGWPIRFELVDANEAQSDGDES